MMATVNRPIARTPDRCDPIEDQGYAMFVGIVSGLATGAVMVALIECATPVADFVTRIFS